MERYVAFLRGVNVGGKNQVPMPALRESLEQAGFADVMTYINSGNVVFSSDISDEKRLMQECEALLANRFRLNMPVAVVSVDDLSAAYQHAPSWWGQDEDSKHNAIFVIPPTTVEQVFAAVGTARPEYERVAHYGRVIFWSAPLKTFSRTRWSKIADSPVYDSVTIRNVNTVRKLLELTCANR